MDKLYVIVRSDLPAGAQLAQSVHAFSAFVHEYPVIEGRWHSGSNNLVCLQVADEKALLALAERARDAGVACSIFREPDFGDEATAIAIEPGGWRIVSSLPLALRQAV